MALDRSSVGVVQGPYSFDFMERDVLLYALSVGAGEGDLGWAFEGHPAFATLPTYAVIPATKALFDAITLLGADLTRLLHGEQSIRWHRPVPTSGRVLTQWRVADVFDKGKGALAVVVADTSLPDGTPLFTNTIALFIRGEGGFDGERGPEAVRMDPPADRAPDVSVEAATGMRQALLYRLNGDRNRLHADPDFAKASGFERPILHGLCTFGFAGRSFVNAALGGDGARLKDLSCRFTGIVMPGDRLLTEAWRLDDGRWVLRTTTGRGTPAVAGIATVA